MTHPAFQQEARSRSQTCQARRDVAPNTPVSLQAVLDRERLPQQSGAHSCSRRGAIPGRSFGQQAAPGGSGIGAAQDRVHGFIQPARTPINTCAPSLAGTNRNRGFRPRRSNGAGGSSTGPPPARRVVSGKSGPEAASAGRGLADVTFGSGVGARCRPDTKPLRGGAGVRRNALRPIGQALCSCTRILQVRHVSACRICRAMLPSPVVKSHQASGIAGGHAHIGTSAIGRDAAPCAGVRGKNDQPVRHPLRTGEIAPGSGSPCAQRYHLSRVPCPATFFAMTSRLCAQRAGARVRSRAELDISRLKDAPEPARPHACESRSPPHACSRRRTASACSAAPPPGRRASASLRGPEPIRDRSFADPAFRPASPASHQIASGRFSRARRRNRTIHCLDAARSPAPFPAFRCPER